jgi:dihydrolipoamide dehydrogenase
MNLFLSLRSAAFASTFVATTAFVSLGGLNAPITSSCRSSSLFAVDGEYDFDVAVIGCGVGGHGAALHSRAQGLSTAVFAGGDVGGTCVNRGCVPSKALLAASGRVREMQDTQHLQSLGIEVDAGNVNYSREGIAAHAKNLANRVKGNLENSLVALGCDVIEGRGMLTANSQEVKDEATGKVYKCKVSSKSIFV